MMQRRFSDRFHITSLFHKLLGFLLLCLVCSGALAAWLITRQMTALVYTQTQEVFESDVRTLLAFLRQEQQRLRTAATDIAHDETLWISVELEVVEEVQNITKDFQRLLEVREIIVTNPQGKVMSRGYDVHDRLDDTLLGNSFGIIEVGGQYHLFGHAPLPKSEGHALGHVVVLSDLSGNHAFFARLRAALGKDAILFAEDQAVGSTLTEAPGRLQPIPVAPGLFTAFDRRFIGTEQDVSEVFGQGAWRVVLLQSAAPLMRAIRRVQGGTVTFTLAFIGLIAGIIGLFFSAHIRKPMALISRGITAITQGNLATRLDLNRRDEWRLIEEALNSMTSSLSENAAALQRKVVETTTLYEIGQDVAAQVDLDATLDRIAERARVLLGSEHAMLALRQAGSDTFLIQAQSGAVNEAFTSVRLQPGQGLGGRVIDTSMPVRVGDYLVEYAESPFLKLVQESGMRAWLGVPLRGQKQVIGVLYVNSSTPNRFDAEGQQLLSALGDQAAIAIEKTQLYEQIQAHAADLEVRVEERTAALAVANAEINTLNEQLTAENLRMGAELSITRQLQQLILPTPEELAVVDGLDIAGYMAPADEVGGDYYDVLAENGQVKIGIGDVTGHGLESGMVMLMTQMAVRTLLTSGETDPVRFLDIINRTLYHNVKRMGTDKNLTLALLDYTDGQVRLSGQHEEMIVVRQDGAVERVDTMDLGFPIGLDEAIADFIDHTTVYLAPGDGVVLYTDGITEAENIGGAHYGLERLCEVVRQHWAQNAEGIKDAVVWDVRRHIGDQEVFDDITLVVVKQQ